MSTKAKEPVAIGKILDKGGYSKNREGENSSEKKSLGNKIYGSFHEKYEKICCTYIPGEKAISVKGKTVKVNLLNDYSLKHFPEDHESKLRESCREILGNEFKIEYGVDKSLLPDEKSVPNRVDDYP